VIAFAIPALAAFLLTLILTPVCRVLCLRWGWVDQPDARKLHRSPIPRAGGIAIFAGFTAGAGAGHAWAILPSVCAAFGIGLLDDIVDVRPWIKIAGQVVAAALLCLGFPVGAWWHVPLMILWLVGCANAVNLIDGLDGLAAGIGVVGTLAAFAYAMLTGNFVLAAVSAPLIGALLGFLPYNFNPASIFMGDCGSNTVGFLLGCFTILWWQSNHRILGLAAPALVLALPILDTALAIFRRFLRLKPIFSADRGHIHHRLLARGFHTRKVACILYGGAGLCACFSILLSTSGAGAIPVIAAFGIVLGIALRYLRYEEFGSVRRVLMGGVLRRVFAADLALRELETAVAAAESIEDCWYAVIANGRALGLSHASMQAYGRKFVARFDEDAAARECWSMRVVLEGAGAIDLDVPFDMAPAGAADLANSLRNVLGSRLETLRPKLALAAAASAGRRR
jgi:UDP-GlcNAc:undecaprenyl-phosphate/decaprenyl-phosphate GlcNAc-1-phosphate transferase